MSRKTSHKRSNRAFPVILGLPESPVVEQLVRATAVVNRRLRQELGDRLSCLTAATHLAGLLFSPGHETSLVRVAVVALVPGGRTESIGMKGLEPQPPSDEADGKWPGHLVALVDNGFVCDPSVDQLGRFGIAVGPTVLPVPPDFVRRGQRPLGRFLDSTWIGIRAGADGTVLAYRAARAQTGFSPEVAELEEYKQSAPRSRMAQRL